MINVTDIAYGRLSAPDLDLMEAFLTDFGMVRAERTKTALFMRGTDAEHHLHVTELGDPAFIGIAFHAASEEDLHTLAEAEGATPVEDLDEPGGGKRVRLTDPDGRQVEVIWGQEMLEPLPVRDVVINTGKERLNRAGDLQRIPSRPAHVKRSAHAVVTTAQVKASNDWYQAHLGLKTTDEIWMETEDIIFAVFNHIDAPTGSYVDHHVFLNVQAEKAGFNHLSFEVADFDDVQIGHFYLKEKGKYRHAWGIGRHTLGSQIFDYWRDPWGRIHEHWTDSDMVNNDHPAGFHSPEAGLANQWGPEFPMEFLDDPEKHAIA